MSRQRHVNFIDFGAAAVHTGMTLWFRWPILMAAYSLPLRPQDAVEMNRMVTEKVAAAVHGSLRSQAEMVRLATGIMTGRLSAKDAPNAAAGITSAAIRPALRTVKANASRLRRRRRR